MSFQGRSLLTLTDFSRAEIEHLITLSARLKTERVNGQRHRRLEGYTLAIVFEKRSTRTRSSFESAFGEEGGYPTFLSGQDIHLGEKEDLKDTARVLGRMYDCIAFRGYKQAVVEGLARWSGVPVYNALTDPYHPTQVLADLMTVREARGSLDGAKISYIGDGRNNVARSLLLGCARVGVSCAIGAPAELAPPQQLITTAQTDGEATGAEITVTTDPEGAVTGADAVYTDVWTSMGEEEKRTERQKLLAPYQVTSELMNATGKKASIFLHCLPARKGEEVTEDVFESDASRVFDQAENRKHTIKAIILATLGRL